MPREEHSPHQFLGRLGTWLGTTIPFCMVREWDRWLWAACAGWLCALSSVLSTHHFMAQRKPARPYHSLRSLLASPNFFLAPFPWYSDWAAWVLSGPSCVSAAPPFLLVMLKRLSMKHSVPLFQVQKCACLLVILEAHFIKQLSALLCSVERDFFFFFLQPSSMFSLGVLFN